MSASDLLFEMLLNEVVASNSQVLKRAGWATFRRLPQPRNACDMLCTFSVEGREPSPASTGDPDEFLQPVNKPIIRQPAMQGK